MGMWNCRGKCRQVHIQIWVFVLFDLSNRVDEGLISKFGVYLPGEKSSEICRNSGYDVEDQKLDACNRWKPNSPISTAATAQSIWANTVTNPTAPSAASSAIKAFNFWSSCYNHTMGDIRFGAGFHICNCNNQFSTSSQIHLGFALSELVNKNYLF